MNTYNHSTVLKTEAIHHLVTDPNGVYLDATCGGGGHTHELLLQFPHCSVIACDWDLAALEATRERVREHESRVRLEYSSFANLPRVLKKLKITKVNGILADFGTSRFQIEQLPGFSFLHDTKLDMRMSPGHQKITAAFLVNKLSEKELADIIYLYGEERHSRRIARAIVEEREARPILSTLHLADLIKQVVPSSGRRIHPATQTFQALRIAVNKELDQISSLLHVAPAMLLEGGRLVTISFHSLEDRLVKQFFKSHKNEFADVIGGVMCPSEEEIKRNSPSRSAKMRVLQKKQ